MSRRTTRSLPDPHKPVHRAPQALAVGGPAALAALAAALDAATPVPKLERLATPKRTAKAVLRLVLLASWPAARLRLREIGPTLFRPDTVLELERIGAALLHLGRRLDALAPAGPRMSLPELSVARDVHGRFAKLASHYFDESTVLGGADLGVGPGRGYLELSQRLSSLHALLQPHQSWLSQDLVAYRETDFDDAPKLAERLASAAALDPNATVSSPEHDAIDDRVGRLWALLRPSYDHLQAALAFVLREVQGAPRVPSLTVALHVPGRKKGEAAEDEGEDEAEGGDAVGSGPKSTTGAALKTGTDGVEGPAPAPADDADPPEDDE